MDRSSQNNAISLQTDTSNELECAICLQTCIHPTKLPCEHIFCFLCIKGVLLQGGKCALCRCRVSLSYLDKPYLLDVAESSVAKTQDNCDSNTESVASAASPAADIEQSGNDGNSDNSYAWYYSGRLGWWQYEERPSTELELAFTSGHRSCEQLIAGYLYVIDFRSMLQYRKSQHQLKRFVIRVVLGSLSNVLGVAGIKCEQQQQSAGGAGSQSTPDASAAPSAVRGEVDVDGAQQQILHQWENQLCWRTASANSDPADAAPVATHDSGETASPNVALPPGEGTSTPRPCAVSDDSSTPHPRDVLTRSIDVTQPTPAAANVIVADNARRTLDVDTDLSSMLNNVTLVDSNSHSYNEQN